MPTASKTKKDPKPFLKWVGGKRQLLPQIRKHLPENYNKYYEPFVGGGAVFFDLLPQKAHLNDINKILMEAYRRIKRDPSDLISLIGDFEDNYLSSSEEKRKEYFYKMRDRYNELDFEDIEKVAILFFLNRTCFNGMYRVNSSNEFNVPHGRYKNPTILDEDNLLLVSESLQDTDLTSVSFEEAVEDAKEGDFIYFDPPYHPLDDTSNFTSYSKDDFLKEDQIKLRDTFANLDKRGCYVLLSNSYTDFIKDIYSDFRQEPVKARRAINSNGDDRGEINEMLVMNY